MHTAVGHLAVMICYDLESPKFLRLAALAGADVLCVPTNRPRLGRPADERLNKEPSRFHFPQLLERHRR